MLSKRSVHLWTQLGEPKTHTFRLAFMYLEYMVGCRALSSSAIWRLVRTIAFLGWRFGHDDKGGATKPGYISICVVIVETVAIDVDVDMGAIRASCGRKSLSIREDKSTLGASFVDHRIIPTRI